MCDSSPLSRSLAYLLSDAGYDVWLSNARGNTWSREHVSLDSCPNCTEYWNFGFDEIGRYLQYQYQCQFIVEVSCL